MFGVKKGRKNIMKNMKKLFTVGCAFAALTCHLASGAEAGNTKPDRPVRQAHAKPNILMIVSDDQGYGDFGFTGNKIVKTPVLDKLSKEGAFYPHFMVAPACTPTRSSLLTGRNHLDTGVWGVGSRGRVRRDETLMPKFFKPSGYQSWAIGKMDGGISMMEMTPADSGFDYWYSPPGGTISYQHKLPGGWGVEMNTDAAIKKIREAGDKPWSLHMNYIIPHLPWHCPDSYADPYRKKGYSEDLAQCYGSIKQMDDQIGCLLDALDKSGQAKNTIVLFISDNGPVDVANGRETGYWNNSKSRRRFTKDWALRNPDGLIGRKGEVWDNGIRSPLLVRWPGKIKPGIRKQAIGVEDILPTLLDLAEIPKDKQPKHLPFAGKSFKASLEDASSTDEHDIFRVATGGPGVPPGVIPDARTLKYSSLHTILRSGAYKFHHLPGGHFRLYNMEKDPAEKNDLSKQMPDRMEAMAKRCKAQWEAIAKRNRTFPMRQLKINNADRPRKSWKLPVLQALKYEGKIRAHAFVGGVKGFQFPGDKVSYAIEVQKPLTVSFVATGKGFDKCAPITLLVNGKPVEATSRTADKIVFGPVELSAGKVPVSLAVAEDAKPGKAIGEMLKLTLKRNQKTQ
jgi:arylsulfatase A-like enzyme